MLKLANRMQDSKSVVCPLQTLSEISLRYKQRECVLLRSVK